MGSTIYVIRTYASILRKTKLKTLWNIDVSTMKKVMDHSAKQLKLKIEILLPLGQYGWKQDDNFDGEGNIFDLI